MLFHLDSMTIGNLTNDTRVSTTGFFNGMPLVDRLCGTYKNKTWSGADSPKSAKPPLGPKRYYTIIDRRGRRVTKWFRNKPLKRLTKKQPNSYDMSAVTDSQPAGSIVATAIRWSDGAVLAVDNYSNVPPTYFLSGGWPAYAGSPPPFDANDDIKLIGKLKEQIRGQDFNLGVFLGEGHQTLRLIGDSAIKLARGYRSFKRGDIAGAMKDLSRSPFGNQVRTKRTLAGNNWLELQYGWLPLLKDVQEGAKAIAHILNAPFIQRYSASITKKSGKHTWDVGSRIVYSTAVGISRKRIIAMVSEQESVPQLLGLLDPELVAWELVPFSFVADWVAPIGPYLEARAFASRLKGTFVTTSTYRRILSGPIGQDWNMGSYYWKFEPAFSGTELNSFSMSRVVSTVLNVPMPVVKPVDKILSLGHCLNGLALLSAIVTGQKLSGTQLKTLGK